MGTVNLEMGVLRLRYLQEPNYVRTVLAFVHARLDEFRENPIWIYQENWSSILAQSEALLLKIERDAGALVGMPLFGMPCAVKDNIDVAGMPTTAACPSFAYTAESDAFCVAKLRAAGALILGKTNMDQFATGLVGSRSPYGSVRNAFNPDFISGGSSSGSALAVALGQAVFALGTDTAGSGRVPAGFNNIVGLKPTRGLVSTAGVVPACRSLDCVSVFALTCQDADSVLEVIQGPDERDAYSRLRPAAYQSLQDEHGDFRFGVPGGAHLDFADNAEYALGFQAACARLESLGGRRIEIDFSIFADTAKMLYQGPWLAERQAAFGDFLADHPGQVLPVLEKIMAPADSLKAVDAFRSFYKLEAYRAACREKFRHIDILVVPTTPTHYSLAEIDADPLATNTRLGTYTNFVNLLDLSALAVPAAMTSRGLPFGITLIAPAFAEKKLLSLGDRFHRATGLTLGVGRHCLLGLQEDIPDGTDRLVPKPPVTDSPFSSRDAGRVLPREGVQIAVAGLHMRGQPLNVELTDLGAKFIREARTAGRYKLYAMEWQGRKFPGLVKQIGSSGMVTVEIWEFLPEGAGRFLQKVREPLGLGTLELEDGSSVKGFLIEAYAAAQGKDITEWGGWVEYLESLSRTRK